MAHMHSSSVEEVEEVIPESAVSSRALADADKIRFESLLAINSLPDGISTLDESARLSLTHGIDHVLDLPGGSTTYLSDSKFHSADSPTTLVAHVSTTAPLDKAAAKEQDATETFQALRTQLAAAVTDGRLLGLFHSKTVSIKTATFADNGVTSINLKVLSSVQGDVEGKVVEDVAPAEVQEDSKPWHRWHRLGSVRLAASLLAAVLLLAGLYAASTFFFVQVALKRGPEKPQSELALDRVSVKAPPERKEGEEEVKAVAAEK